MDTRVDHIRWPHQRAQFTVLHRLFRPSERPRRCRRGRDYVLYAVDRVFPRPAVG